MKAYTDISQSKKLAEILPLESADMYWQYIEEDNGQLQWFCFPKDFSINQHNIVSAWSLAALLDVFPMVVGRDLDMYCCWQNSKNLHSRHYDNPIDACYEMIITLHEQKLL